MNTKESSGSEWWLYGAVAFACAALFVVSYFFRGSEETFGQAITAILFAGMTLSAKWKAQPDIVHQGIVILAILTVTVLIFLAGHQGLAQKSRQPLPEP